MNESNLIGQHEHAKCELEDMKYRVENDREIIILLQSLVEMCKAVTPFMAKNDARESLKGCNFIEMNGKLHLRAIDGHKCMQIPTCIDFPEGKNFIVDKDTISAIAKLKFDRRIDEVCELNLETMTLKTQSCDLKINIVNGMFPDLELVFLSADKQSNKQEDMGINAEYAEQLFKSAKILGNKKYHCVRIIKKDTYFKVECPLDAVHRCKEHAIFLIMEMRM